eukprot:5939733-Ditylum_brightwellii.AAC.1
METIAQVIKDQDIQDGDVAYSLVKDSPTFTKCLAAVTKHVFPKKAYKMQKKYTQNILHFPVPDRVTATKISCKEFVDVIEDRILNQQKLEFEKEEEAELQKLLRKTIAHAKKEDRKRKCQNKPKLHHERCHGLGKCHQ